MPFTPISFARMSEGHWRSHRESECHSALIHRSCPFILSCLIGWSLIAYYNLLCQMWNHKDCTDHYLCCTDPNHNNAFFYAMARTGCRISRWCPYIRVLANYHIRSWSVLWSWKITVYHKLSGNCIGATIDQERNNMYPFTMIVLCVLCDTWRGK